MTKKYLVSKLLLLLLVMLISSITTSVFGQQGYQPIKLPDGNWSFGIFPYHGSNSQSLPVIVGSVTSELNAGAGATKVGILNNSNKPVTAIRFRWLLFEGEKRDKVLRQGSSPLLGLRTILASGEKRTLSHQVVSLMRIYRLLAKDNRLTGDYEVEILVEEVRFADNSVWKINEQRQSVLRNNFTQLNFKIIPTTFTQCPKQKCKSNTAGTGNTVYYSCDTSSFSEVCSVSPDARSCTVTACGFGGGGGGGTEEPIIIDP